MPPRALTGTRGRRVQTAKQTRENPVAMPEAEVDIEEVALAAFTTTTNILIHGPSGHGKTVFAGGAPNSVFLSSELEGAVSAKVTGSRARLWPAPQWEHAVAGVKKAYAELGDQDWLIVDSGTKFQEMYMRWILQTVNSQNPQRDLDIPAIQDHQKYQNRFKRWFDSIIDGPFNSIFITQSMTVEDAEGETRVIPLLLGKQGEISDYCSAQAGVGVYYSVSRESREAGAVGPAIIRRALFQPYPPWWAKDRYNALGISMDIEHEDYTAMARIIDTIERAKKEAGNIPAARRSSRRGRAVR
jgi:AAA domain